MAAKLNSKTIIVFIVSITLVLISAISGWVYINTQSIAQKERELQQQKDLKEKEIEAQKDAAKMQADSARDAAKSACVGAGGNWFSC